MLVVCHAVNVIATNKQRRTTPIAASALAILCDSLISAIMPGVGVAMRVDVVEEATAAVVAAMFIIMVVVLTDM